MIVATIDIGTNTVLLLVAQVTPEGALFPLVYEQRVPRLGRGVDVHRRLAPDAMDRVITVLLEYRSLFEQHHPDKVAVFATSAVRDAANKQEFAALVQERTGLSLEVLSGADEAFWTFRGAISGISGVRHATVVDIGGGSTELTWGLPEAIEGSVSLDIGSVRLTERILKADPPGREELRALRAAARHALSTVVPRPPSDSTLVGVAGTATTLALLAQGYRTFSLEAVSGHTMKLADVSRLVRMLEPLPSKAILEMGRYMEGRHDIITAGAVILEEIMLQFGFTSIVVSERGVRFGVALREAGK